MSIDPQPIIDAARDAVPLANRVGAVGDIPVAIASDGTISVMADVLKERDARAPVPRRFTANLKLEDLGSLKRWIQRYSDPLCSMIYAQTREPTITAIINDEPPTVPQMQAVDGEVTQLPMPQLPLRIGPGSRDIRAAVALRYSPEWIAWSSVIGKEITQDALAVHLDDWGHTITTPGPTAPAGFAGPRDMIQMARDLLIVTSGKYSRKIDPHSGLGTLEIAQEQGPPTSTPVPRGFKIVLPIFEDSHDVATIDVYLRFRLADGAVKFSLRAPDAQAVVESELEGLASDLAAGCAVPFLLGAPPPPRG